MRGIPDILAARRPAFSCEFFTPKTPEGEAALRGHVERLAGGLALDFISVTYGAGGSTRQGTTRLVGELQRTTGLPVMHHLTCIGHSREELTAILREIEALGVRNVLALRGDPPRGETEWRPHPQGFQWARELIELIRADGYPCSVGVAGFPERHPASPDWDSELRHLKGKIDAGADFIVTQLFFEADLYFRYVERVRGAGITVPVIPGILPIANYPNLVRFVANCGASLPAAVHERFAPLAEDEAATLAAGIGAATDLCRELIAGGAPGIHFYTANKSESVLAVGRALGAGK